MLKTGILQGLDKDADFREFCAGLSVLGDHEYSLISSLRSLLEKAASRGLDLSRAEEMLPPPDRTVTKESFAKVRDELAAFDKLPAKASGVFQTLEKIIQKFPTSKALAAEVPDLGNIEAGMYQVIFILDGKREVKKLIIQ